VTICALASLEFGGLSLLFWLGIGDIQERLGYGFLLGWFDRNCSHMLLSLLLRAFRRKNDLRFVSIA